MMKCDSTPLGSAAESADYGVDDSRAPGNCVFQFDRSSPPRWSPTAASERAAPARSERNDR